MTRYRLSYTKHDEDGRPRRKVITTYSYDNAVTLLNTLILDCGYRDTTMTAIKVRELPVLDIRKL